MTLRILTHSAERPPNTPSALLRAAGRIVLEIKRYPGITVETSGSLASNDVEIALAHDLWNAGDLIGLYHADKRLALLIAMAEETRLICVSSTKDTPAALKQLSKLKKRLKELLKSETFLKITQKEKRICADYLSEAADAVTPLYKTNVKNWTLSCISAEAADDVLFELRHIRQSLAYQIKDNKRHLDNRAVMRENREALGAQRKIIPADLAELAAEFLKTSGAGHNRSGS
jgi:hypothetical protein